MKPNNVKTQKSLLSAPLVMAVVVTACALLLFSTALAGIAQAAKISFTPGSATVTAAPGDEIDIPLSIELSALSLPSTKANFQVLQRYGDIDSSWFSTIGYVELTASQPHIKKNLHLKIPSDAKGEQLFATFKTLYVRSNDRRITTGDFTVNLKIEEKIRCKKAPSVISVVAKQSVIKAKNNQTEKIVFNGHIEMPEDCTENSAWYILNDEYAPPNNTEISFDVNSDGSFTTSVPVETSRNGRDKDGREYTVVFGADNEFDRDEGIKTSIVISHDNRKK